MGPTERARTGGGDGTGCVGWVGAGVLTFDERMTRKRSGRRERESVANFFEKGQVAGRRLVVGDWNSITLADGDCAFSTAK